MLAHTRARQIVVDLGTSPVDLTRSLAAKFVDRGARYADAPIARTREAAEAGTLSIMAESLTKDTALALLCNTHERCSPA